MAKNASNDAQALEVSTAPLSTDTLLPSLESQRLSLKRLAVVGKGLRRNNVLLTQVLQADIQRWYPWSALQHGLSKQAASLVSKLPLSPFTPQLFNTLSSPLPDAFIGWGHKKSYQRANKAAKKQQVASLSIEDGFLRSLDSGIKSRHGLSMVVDDIGIYFDSNHHSRLEQLIVERTQHAPHSAQSSVDKERAQHLISQICNEQLSKYNAVTYCPSLDELAANNSPTSSTSSLKPHVLLIDQVIGDASIKGAGADKQQFKRMLKAACRAHPEAYIWIKAHPAAKSGYLTSLKLPKNVRVLSQALNPIKLLEQVSHVYTVSSHMGFEALMLDKTVHCFGVNWYSGWGLTDDSSAPKLLLKTVKARRQVFSSTLLTTDDSADKAVNLSRNKQVSSTVTASLETLFYSAYINYSHYVDPATKQSCDIDTAIQWLLTNRHWQSHLLGDLTIYEFSRWKLPFVKAFVDLPLTTLFIKPKPRLKNLLHPDHYRVNYQQSLLVWGLAKRQQLHRRFAKQQLADMPSIYCMEDGFIRSNGLGATLLAPLSVVIDKLGIYYDATQPSDLEKSLRECQVLTAQQILRVQTLQDKLLTQRVSKYNVGVSVDSSKKADGSQVSWIEVVRTTSKLRLLIVGQVEDDLSAYSAG